MMIFTLTPNPSVDRTISVPEIRFNSVLRSKAVRLDWGGKGFNVSRSLSQFGIDSLALAWVGGGTGKILADGLQRLGIQTDFVWVDEDTRTNTMLLEEGSSWHIKVNEPGPSISEDDVEQLFLKAENYAKKGDLWILSGSLPPDVPVDFYGKLIKAIKIRGAKVYLDASGDPLRFGCQAGPYLVKPNSVEAAHIVGFEIQDQEDAKRAALPFLRMGIEILALTMGSTGLLLASQQQMIYATAPKVVERNASGAGDALLSGIIYAQLHDLPLLDVARWGVATGAASVMMEGVSEFNFAQVDTLLPDVEARVINVM